jgi:Tfp pilus assembly protein PilN
MAKPLTGVWFEGPRFRWVTCVSAGGDWRRADAGTLDLDAAAGTEAGAVGALREALPGKRRGVVAGLPADRVLLRVVTLPAVDPGEVAEMAALQADKFSPFPMETVTVACEELARSDESVLVLLAIARTESIEQAAGLLREAGLVPERIDVAVLGWWRTVREAAGVGGGGRRLLVWHRGGQADLVVVQDGVPLWFRTVDLPDLDSGAELAEEAAQLLLAQELEGGPAPVHSVVWGEAQAASGAAAALQERTGGSVECRLPDELPGAGEGLVLRAREGGGLDLTPRAWQEQAAGRRLRRRLLTGFGAVLGAWLLVTGLLAGAYAVEQRGVARLKAQVARWRGPAEEVRELRRRVLDLERYGDDTHSALECLREISTLLPQGIDLVSYNYLKGDSVRIVGRAGNPGLIYEFKTLLDASGLFTSVELGAQNQERRQNLWNFDVAMGLPGGES